MTGHFSTDVFDDEKISGKNLVYTNVQAEKSLSNERRIVWNKNMARQDGDSDIFLHGLYILFIKLLSKCFKNTLFH